MCRAFLQLIQAFQQRGQVGTRAGNPRFDTEGRAISRFRVGVTTQRFVQHAEFHVGTTAVVRFQDALDVLLDGPVEFLALVPVQQVGGERPGQLGQHTTGFRADTAAGIVQQRYELPQQRRELRAQLLFVARLKAADRRAPGTGRRTG